MMLHPFKLLLAAAVTIVVGVATGPTVSQAQSSKSEATSAKPDAAAGAKKDQAATDEFEENRRAHVQKSKENNANKGAN